MKKSIWMSKPAMSPQCQQQPSNVCHGHCFEYHISCGCFWILDPIIRMFPANNFWICITSRITINTLLVLDLFACLSKWQWEFCLVRSNALVAWNYCWFVAVLCLFVDECCLFVVERAKLAKTVSSWFSSHSLQSPHSQGFDTFWLVLVGSRWAGWV